MSAMQLDNAAIISAGIATAAAECCCEEDAELLAAMLTVLSDFMVLILSQKALRQAAENKTDNKAGGNHGMR